MLPVQLLLMRLKSYSNDNKYLSAELVRNGLIGQYAILKMDVKLDPRTPETAQDNTEV